MDHLDTDPRIEYGTILAFGALIGMPAIFSAIGFILGIVEAILYNLFANLFGLTFKNIFH